MAERHVSTQLIYNEARDINNDLIESRIIEPSKERKTSLSSLNAPSQQADRTQKSVQAELTDEEHSHTITKEQNDYRDK